MKNRIVLWGAASLILGGLVAVGLYLYFHAFSPDRGKYPVRGIDVSHHQRQIDWRRVAADDVAFAVIKATEGGDHVDDAFDANLREARAAGLAVGAYHFFTFCRPGADQAKNFISVVPRDQPLLPPVVDIEFHGNCPRRPSPEELQVELSAFLGPVEAAFGKTAILYVTDAAARAYAGQIAGRPRWVRSLVLQPGHDDWIYWQYHDRGRVDGISGDVDLNVLQGGQATLAALFAAPESISPETLLSR
ncbi:lysozyme [Mesorhizobium sp. M9A.F.Ca.ET.002.03.1.2]|uniref:glycoside hydrolase family 25 protein n=1 Tax=Mesorhizobium sp. M9A.F.Ca.ET.002.03.1.2 TaxID=2493668 RepID=UPI000F75C0EC|nr:GH25 family lysozyme [Mesorhizobium sp. M9A.F.Ca.ET.002.03.1.2]AZN99009.1 lysozyme [Mesorhizobium sp. M9A.F.Ca.ET.002.03.1.2]